MASSRESSHRPYASTHRHDRFESGLARFVNIPPGAAPMMLPHPAKLAWSRRTPERLDCARVIQRNRLFWSSRMLAPLLATEDPYAAASIFSEAGWKVEYESARDGDQPRACLSLAHSRIELVLPSDPYVVPRGLGIEFLDPCAPRELSGLFLLHRAAGVVFSEMRERRPGERGFRAEIIGYRFTILGGDPDPDLAMVATDPRIMALADGCVSGMARTA